MSGIGIVGGGALAQALGRALRDRGASIVALAARRLDRATRAAAFIGPSVNAVLLSDVPALPSHLIVAVADDAIEAVAERLADAGFSRGVVVHTCGAKGPEALGALRAGESACGVLHPLQTVPSPELGVARLQRITFGVGGDPEAAAWAEELVTLLEGRAVHIAAGGFAAYHASAVLAGNAIAALMDAAVELMARAGVDAHTALDALAPLCRTSTDNALTVGPLAALTGPIARGDAATVREHLRALADAPPDVRNLYVSVSRRLLDLAGRRGLDPTAGQRIGELLERAERHEPKAAWATRG